MDTPKDVFEQSLAATGDPIAAIRSIRERFGLDVAQAKEIWLQVAGVAPSLMEYQQDVAQTLEQMFREDES